MLAKRNGSYAQTLVKVRICALALRVQARVPQVDKRPYELRRISDGILRELVVVV